MSSPIDTPYEEQDMDKPLTGEEEEEIADAEELLDEEDKSGPEFYNVSGIPITPD